MNIYNNETRSNKYLWRRNNNGPKSINHSNNVLTSALNATMVTYNGNEFVLQNDME